jgi:hypothetical protein
MNSIKPSMNDSTGPSMSESTEPTMNSVEPSVSESTEPTVDSVEQGQVRIADWRQTQEAVKDVDPALLDRIVDWSSGLVEPSDDEGEEKGFYKAVYRIASETNGPSITIEIPNGSELGKKMQWRVALSFSNDGKSDWKRANVGKDGQVQAYRMNGGDDDKRDIVLLNNKQIEQLLGYLDEIKPHLERATK